MSRYSRLSLKMANVPFKGDVGNPFSDNKVTGESINFPIVGTCSPTKVCADECYAASGPITWPASLGKQFRNYMNCVADPIGFAERVLAHRKEPFITWNGSGDLFAESVMAINHIGMTAPEVPVWVRTRIPKYASMIKQSANVWVHFSLDRSSMRRREMVDWKTKNHHYSYQYAKGETGPWPDGMLVVFGNDYKLPEGVGGKESCPLNENESIAGVCLSCRRCFGGGCPVPQCHLDRDSS